MELHNENITASLWHITELWGILLIQYFSEYTLLKHCLYVNKKIKRQMSGNRTFCTSWQLNVSAMCPLRWHIRVYIVPSRTSCCLLSFPSSAKTSFCDTFRIEEKKLCDTSGLQERRSSTALLWLQGWQAVIRSSGLIAYPPLVCQAPTACAQRFSFLVWSWLVYPTSERSLGVSEKKYRKKQFLFKYPP